jgi:hypothetical protein
LLTGAWRPDADTGCLQPATITTVDGSFLVEIGHYTSIAIGTVGYYTSIAIGADGLPVISYFDSTNQSLKVAKCGNAACSSRNVLSTVDAILNTGGYTSIAIGADGLPVISYYDGATQELKVAKCGNVFCAPYFRRR